MGLCSYTTKKSPQEPGSLWSGTGAITVITSESRHYLHCSPLSQAGECEARVGECSYLALPFTSSTFLFVLHTFVYSPFPLCLFFLLSFRTSCQFLHKLIHIFSFFFSPPCKNTCSYIHPYLVLFVKQNLFQWDGNQMKGNHAVTVQLLIVPAHPTLFVDCESQTRQMLRLYASSVPYIHLPSRNS